MSLIRNALCNINIMFSYGLMLTYWKFVDGVNLDIGKGRLYETVKAVDVLICFARRIDSSDR